MISSDQSNFWGGFMMVATLVALVVLPCGQVEAQGKHKHGRPFEALKAKIESLEGKIDALPDNSAAIDSLKDQVDALSDDAVMIKDGIDRLETRADRLDGKVEALESRLDSIAENVEILLGVFEDKLCEQQGGAFVGGFCWVLGGSGQSCVNACAAEGFDTATLEGTRDYAGSGGTAAQCTEVLDALDARQGTYLGNTGCGGGLGCAEESGGIARIRCKSPATSLTERGLNARRACSCE